MPQQQLPVIYSQLLQVSGQHEVSQPVLAWSLASSCGLPGSSGCLCVVFCHVHPRQAGRLPGREERLQHALLHLSQLL